MESDKRALQEELNRTENRSTKLELQRMSTEGDLQRLQMIVQEKDAAIQVNITQMHLVCTSNRTFSFRNYKKSAMFNLVRWQV